MSTIETSKTPQITSTDIFILISLNYTNAFDGPVDLANMSVIPDLGTTMISPHVVMEH